MAEYYAVSMPSDYLQHYGIKGMRWGVRKAIILGDGRKLQRNFNKAQKKLTKLNQKTDIVKQAELAKKHNKRAIAALGVSAAALGVAAGNEIVARRLAKDFKPNNFITPDKPMARKKRILGKGKGIKKVGEALGTGPVGYRPAGFAGVIDTVDDVKAKINATNPFARVHNAAITASVAGMGAAAYQKGRALIAKHRTTKAGHEKAVAKRNAWEKEMRAAFKGTKYANQIGVANNQNKKKKKRR